MTETTEARSGKLEKRNEFAGRGTGLQILGVGVFLGGIVFLGYIGAILSLFIAVPLLIVGSARSQSWRCGVCRNPVDSKDVRICPHCQATLTR